MNVQAVEQMTSPRGRRPVRGSRVIVAGVTIVALLVAVSVFALGGDSGDSGDSAGSRSGAMTQTSDQGGVTVEAIWSGDPLNPAFAITLDTHTVNLDDYDLSQIAVLRAGSVEIAPVSWDAPKGGHHREGQLIFPATTADGDPTIGATATELVLVVRGVGDVEERVLRWTL